MIKGQFLKCFSPLRRGVLSLFVIGVMGMTSASAQDATTAPPAYAGSDSCADCHADAVAAWEGSHHALAWTEPGPDTIVGDFKDAEFSHDGTLTKFSTDGRVYRIEVTEKDGVTTDYAVHSVAGIEPLQQYLLETEEGRLQSFDVAWDDIKKEWYHLYPDQDLPPKDGLHWTGAYKNWNARCAECHATGFEKKYDAETRSYASTQVEIGVGCEACHGPGQTHIDWATGKENTQELAELSPIGLTIDYSSGDPEVLIQQCAGCHSRREAFGDGNPLPGTAYGDAYRLATLRPGLYHADGQILDEVYVYGSFLQSKMYANGVSCSNCHTPHSAGFVAEGNALCTQCHTTVGRDDFPTLKPADYDSSTHHFHDPESAAGQCQSCHMPERTYMGIDVRSDHSFRIPRPDLAAQTAAPDSCTTCHTDQTPSWAAEQLAVWYPDSVNRGPHYGQTLAAARRDPIAAQVALIDLAMSETMPSIVRATAIELASQASGPALADTMEPLMQAEDPLVREASVLTQRGASDQDRVLRLLPLLGDPVQAVRIAAAREMLNAPVARLPKTHQANLQAALGEWQTSLRLRSDQPEAHLAIGGAALVMRNPNAAIGAFSEAARLDPQRVEAWTMIARIQAAIGDEPALRQTLKDAIDANPKDESLRDMQAQLN